MSDDKLTPAQREWRKLVDEVGEEVAEQEAVRQLRRLADLIEQKGWPHVFSAKLMPTGSAGFENDRFIERIEISVTYPWPG